MREMRKIGYTCKKLGEVYGYTDDHIAWIFGCSTNNVRRFYSGQMIPSFEQITMLAKLYHTTVTDLLYGDSIGYERDYVHAFGKFANIEHREEILDIIDDYITLLEVAERCG